MLWDQTCSISDICLYCVGSFKPSHCFIRSPSTWLTPALILSSCDIKDRDQVTAISAASCPGQVARAKCSCVFVCESRRTGEHVGWEEMLELEGAWGRVGEDSIKLFCPGQDSWVLSSYCIPGTMPCTFPYRTSFQPPKSPVAC